MEPVTSNAAVVVDAAEWERVSGGWCGNDPLSWRNPPPPEPWYAQAIVSIGDKVSLNPQPLPPKAGLVIGY